MTRTKTWIAVASSVAVGGLAGGGVAQSAGESFAKYNTAITKGTFNVTAVVKQPGTPADADPVVRNSEVVMHAEGSADQGPWTDGECKDAGRAINALVGLAVDSALSGDLGSAAVYAQEAENTMDQAVLEGGCSIKHKEGVPPTDDPVLY